MGHFELLDYFLKEARHMQRLAHPNIIPVLEFCEQPNGAYFVMPYLERGSLDRWLQSGRPLDAALAQRIAVDVASALQYAHGRGIIHRDLKPQNILLDAYGRAFLTDFGRKAVEGTPHYLSPGAARGEHEDTRSDVYSFGAVLYEMLTGQAPYAGKLRGEILQEILAGPPKPIRQIRPEAPAALTRIAEKAMNRSLDQRYAHVSYVVADLENEGARPAVSVCSSRGRLTRALILKQWALRSPGVAAIIIGFLACGVP